MSDLSRRTLLGTTGTVAAATVLTTAGPARAAGPGGKAAAPRTAGTTTLKYTAYLLNEEGEMMTYATFDNTANAGDMWAFVDAAKHRFQQQYPSYTFTGVVERHDEVVTAVPHP